MYKSYIDEHAVTSIEKIAKQRTKDSEIKIYLRKLK